MNKWKGGAQWLSPSNGSMLKAMSSKPAPLPRHARTPNSVHATQALSHLTASPPPSHGTASIQTHRHPCAKHARPHADV